MTSRFLPIGSIRKDNYWGYLWIKVGTHPAFKPGWVKLHHYVWWQYRRQVVPRGWVIHHKDENREHNKMSNLKLMTRAAHARLHNLGSKHSEEQRVQMSEAAKRRCTPEWRAAVSARVKQQHAAGKLGRSTWSQKSERQFSAKMSTAWKRYLTTHPHPRKGRVATPEQRKHYRQAAIKREAARKATKCATL